MLCSDFSGCIYSYIFKYARRLVFLNITFYAVFTLGFKNMSWVIRLRADSHETWPIKLLSITFFPWCPTCVQILLLPTTHQDALGVYTLKDISSKVYQATLADGLSDYKENLYKEVGMFVVWQ